MGPISADLFLEIYYITTELLKVKNPNTLDSFLLF